MGRGDGTGRIVSPEGSDDRGAGILHVDMDAFYASVAVLDDPSLAGKPVIIGARDARSVVSSASYEARRFGVRSAMPVGQALRLCPQAEVVAPAFPRYRELSDAVMRIFHDFTPLVEPLSIDEAFLDVRGAGRIWGSPRRIAERLRARVRQQTGLTCSVGGAATKHVAKMASTLSKPDGLLIIAAADTARFLAPRSVRALWGVGPKAAEALESRGIRIVSDILSTPREVLDRALGPAMGSRVWELARGMDSRAVQTERLEKSIGHEETFHSDVSDRALLRSEFLRLADLVGVRLRHAERAAQTISIKVRFSDFSTLTRSRTLLEATDVGQRLGEEAWSLFEALENSRPVRLIGVRGERLGGAGGGASLLWDDDAERRALEGAWDAASERFGRGAIVRGSSVRRHPGAGQDDIDVRGRSQDR